MRYNLIIGAALLFQLVACLVSIAVAQEVPIHISGIVQDSETGKPIEDASIVILSATNNETGIGISTNKSGAFDFHFSYRIPFKIRVTHVSYRPIELEINELDDANGLVFRMVPNVLGEDVVITAPLVTENELKETKTIDKISTVDVQQLASFDVYDLVSTLREVDVATQSMTMQSVNTRGFNASANKRFLQLTDGIDNRAPGLSFPIGNLMGLPDLDIASVEILPGPSSTRYGSSALNGVMIMNSRDPFEDQGVSFEVKSGVNDFNFNGSEFFQADGNGMYDFQGRIAYSIADRFAVKITGNYSQGTDWFAENYENIGYGEDYERHPDQAGYNGVNVYGDESYVFQKVFSEGEPFQNSQGVWVLPQSQYGPVTRTGYREEDLVNYDYETLRSAASVHFKISENYKIKFGGKYGITNSLYTGDSRVRLENFSMYQTNIEFDFNNLNILGYSSWQNSGDSYDVNSLAEKMITSAKSDEEWYRDFITAYENGLPIFGVPPGNVIEARKFADSGISLGPGAEASGRFEPGSKDFLNKLNEIKYSLDPENGAAIRDNSQLYHLQSSYDVPSFLPNTNVQVGGNFRYYELISAGTIFPDTAGNDITNYEYGSYISFESAFFNENLNVNTALRYDKNENFSSRLSPQVSANLVLNEKHFFRASYQHGFRYPGVREQFIKNNLGSAKVLGGLKENINDLNLQLNAITLESVNDYNEKVGELLNEGYNQFQSEIANLQILENGIIGEDQLLNIKPEVVNTFELGYKRLFTPQFYIDINSYVSFYDDFIGITRVVKTRTSPIDNLLVAAGQINNSLESDRYYIYSNAEDKLTVYGASFSLDYISGGFISSLNGSYSQLYESPDDPITPGFNTPPFKLNFEWGHREITDNLGFKMTYRMRTGYRWESSFLDGPIDTYGHFDVQLNVRIPKAKSTLKFGITNLGVKEYYNIYGGPSIGSVLFATLNFNPKMFQ